MKIIKWPANFEDTNCKKIIFGF